MRPTPIRTSSEKFIELRLKTDRDLKLLVENALNRAHRMLQRGDSEQAEGIYARALALLTFVRMLPEQQRQELEQQIGRLRAVLDQATPRQRLAS